MSTRQEILDYLAKNAWASAEDLAQVVGKTRANIQYHLKQLERAGMIISVNPHTVSSERGRPRRNFSLTQAERPNNLMMLADVLLNLLQLSPATPHAHTGLVEIAKNMIKLPTNPASATARLNRLVRELSNRGYQARWEAHSRGPEIVFRNCPYAALLAGHPELCRMDALILESHLGQPMVQNTRIQLPQVSACRFSPQNSVT